MPPAIFSFLSCRDLDLPWLCDLMFGVTTNYTRFCPKIYLQLDYPSIPEELVASELDIAEVWMVLHQTCRQPSNLVSPKIDGSRQNGWVTILVPGGPRAAFLSLREWTREPHWLRGRSVVQASGTIESSLRRIWWIWVVDWMPELWQTQVLSRRYVSTGPTQPVFVGEFRPRVGGHVNLLEPCDNHN